MPFNIILMRKYFKYFLAALAIFGLLMLVSQADSLGNSISGTWRVMSMRTDYKRGFSETIVRTNTMRVSINPNHTWKFSSSSGTWKIADIKSSDWNEWGIASYGPIKKIILNNWNKKTASGPIEISSGNVDAIWIVYQYTSSTKGPGITQMKLGARY